MYRVIFSYGGGVEEWQHAKNVTLEFFNYNDAMQLYHAVRKSPTVGMAQVDEYDRNNCVWRKCF